MTEREAYEFERAHHDVMIIDSRAKGLKYIFDEDRAYFAIAGEKGATAISIAQAKALRDEIDDIIELRAYITARIISERKEKKHYGNKET